MVYAFCVEPATKEHVSADSHERHCHGKGVTFDLHSSPYLLSGEALAMYMWLPAMFLYVPATHIVHCSPSAPVNPALHIHSAIAAIGVVELNGHF